MSKKKEKKIKENIWTPVILVFVSVLITPGHDCIQISNAATYTNKAWRDKYGVTRFLAYLLF